MIVSGNAADSTVTWMETEFNTTVGLPKASNPRTDTFAARIACPVKSAGSATVKFAARLPDPLGWKADTGMSPLVMFAPVNAELKEYPAEETCTVSGVTISVSVSVPPCVTVTSADAADNENTVAVVGADTTVSKPIVALAVRVTWPPSIPAMSNVASIPEESADLVRSPCPRDDRHPTVIVPLRARSCARRSFASSTPATAWPPVAATVGSFKRIRWSGGRSAERRPSASSRMEKRKKRMARDFVCMGVSTRAKVAGLRREARLAIARPPRA